MPTARMEHIGQGAWTEMKAYTVANLSTVFFPPGEEAALAVATTHEHFNVLTVHMLGLGPISYSVSILEVDTMPVKKMHSLLLIIWTTALKYSQRSESLY